MDEKDMDEKEIAIDYLIKNWKNFCERHIIRESDKAYEYVKSISSLFKYNILNELSGFNELKELFYSIYPEGKNTVYLLTSNEDDYVFKVIKKIYDIFKQDPKYDIFKYYL